MEDVDHLSDVIDSCDTLPPFDVYDRPSYHLIDDETLGEQG